MKSPSTPNTLTDQEIAALIKEGVRAMGLLLPDNGPPLFVKYLRELKSWNNKINLTSITDEREIVIRHFLDSLSVCRIIKEYGCKSLIDIGSGAGLPGIPLKIAMPELELLLMDSVEKKVHFMRHAIRTLALDAKIKAIKARAEDETTIAEYQNRFDGAISRAFASLNDFIRAASPYVRPGGAIIAIKGPAATEEITNTPSQNLTPPTLIDIPVPLTNRKNTIIVVRKIQ